MKILKKIFIPCCLKILQNLIFKVSHLIQYQIIGLEIVRKHELIYYFLKTVTL